MSSEGQIHPCHDHCRLLFLTPENFHCKFIHFSTIYSYLSPKYILFLSWDLEVDNESLSTKEVDSQESIARCGTFRVESSFPANARSRLVFPDPGGPSSKDILNK
jgi:hypothetical protein